jgi:hypothetical protein
MSNNNESFGDEDEITQDILDSEPEFNEELIDIGEDEDF